MLQAVKEKWAEENYDLSLGVWVQSDDKKMEFSWDEKLFTNFLVFSRNVDEENFVLKFKYLWRNTFCVCFNTTKFEQWEIFLKLFSAFWLKESLKLNP